MHTLSVSPRRIARVLAAAMLFLVVASTLGQILKFYFGRDHVYGLVPLFSLDMEANVPTWYASVTLLLCAVLLGVIAAVRYRESERWARHWAGLALVFLYVSVDEGASIHELLVEPLRTALGTTGPLYFAWVIPFGVLVVLLGLVYTRFLLALPPSTRRLFVAAAAVFIGGALGVEMAAGPWAERHGFENPVWAVFFTIEETMEMAGVLLFLYALLRYLEDHVGGIRVVFASRPESTVTPERGEGRGVGAAGDRSRGSGPRGGAAGEDSMADRQRRRTFGAIRTT